MEEEPDQMKFRIMLNGEKIGESDLENGDPPMGVVFGKAILTVPGSPTSFILEYCKKQGIEITANDPSIPYFSTRDIPLLKILNDKNMEITGVGGTYFDGNDSELQVSILGIESDVYDKEFPGYYKRYEAGFGK